MRQVDILRETRTKALAPGKMSFTDPLQSVSLMFMNSSQAYGILTALSGSTTGHHNPPSLFLKARTPSEAPGGVFVCVSGF